jgi:Cu+-exporting ATPase
VVAAFHDVSSAFKDKERMQLESEAYYRQQIIGAAGRDAVELLSGARSGVDDGLWRELRPLLSGEAVSEVLRAKAAQAERVNKAGGEAAAFRLRQAAHMGNPALAELRLYLDTVQATLANKEKMIIDPNAAGRRQLFLADPDRFNVKLPPVFNAPTQPRNAIEDEEP